MYNSLKTLLDGYGLFGDIYRKKRVVVTGHTGFKGSWLCAWLKAMGANVLGYALPPLTNPNHLTLLEPQIKIESAIADIRDIENIKHILADFRPEIVFHLAAQSLVRQSYLHPIETLQTNIVGTANVFEACRFVKTIKAIINVSSDKCYENKEWVWGYRENDPMGGYDPYSASKGCAELIASAYRNSFFNPKEYGLKHNILLASVRAGNVIGGGDWAKDRLVTDIMQAASEGKKFLIRNPEAIRPWQHVLDPLSGYLLLGQKLLEGKKEYADAWNFGPSEDGLFTVIQVVREMKKNWNKIDFFVKKNNLRFHEADLLKLDSSKARSKLLWKSIWATPTACLKTVEWYKKYYENNSIITLSQLKTYIQKAQKEAAKWIYQKASDESEGMLILQEKSGFATSVLADKKEDVWNVI